MTSDSQMQAVQQDIDRANAIIIKAEGELAAAKQAGDKAEVAFLRESLLELRKEVVELRRGQNTLLKLLTKAQEQGQHRLLTASLGITCMQLSVHGSPQIRLSSHCLRNGTLTVAQDQDCKRVKCWLVFLPCSYTNDVAHSVFYHRTSCLYYLYCELGAVQAQELQRLCHPLIIYQVASMVP